MHVSPPCEDREDFRPKPPQPLKTQKLTVNVNGCMRFISYMNACQAKFFFHKLEFLGLVFRVTPCERDLMATHLGCQGENTGILK
jgi:hypothetical protein